MSEKKYKVFISSTYTDLKKERHKILDVLLMADCIPVDLEAFVAINDEQFEVYKKVIDLCDYYILIIGKRYGHINEDTGMSYTEMEYHYAKDRGIPVLVFANDNPIETPEYSYESDTDNKMKLEAFKQDAMRNRLATVWTSPEDLMGKLNKSIMKAKTEMPRPGWQHAQDLNEASLRRDLMESHEKIEELQKELAEANAKLAGFIVLEDVTFDESEYVIKYHYFVQSGDFGVRYNGEKSAMLSEIFRILAKELLNVSLNEQAIESIFKTKMIGTENLYILDDPGLIDRILNQLQALNLIKSHLNEENSEIYWSLTTKGRNI